MGICELWMICVFALTSYGFFWVLYKFGIFQKLSSIQYTSFVSLGACIGIGDNITYIYV